MTNEQEIKEWWERRIDNYINNYARWNKLTFPEAQVKFLIETHKKFLKGIPQALEKFMKGCSWTKSKIDSWCTHTEMAEEQIC